MHLQSEKKSGMHELVSSIEMLLEVIFTVCNLCYKMLLDYTCNLQSVS
jgi:hypothetical protein